MLDAGALLLIVAQRHPRFALFLLTVGALRFVMKPAHVLLQRLTIWTPWKRDDEILQRIERSKTMSFFFFVIDWLGSIKLPGAK